MAFSPALRKAVAEAKNKYARSDGKTIKPKEGRNIYRFLAPTANEAPWVGPTGQFWADLGVHWIKADKNSKPIAVVGSRDICYQEPCPVGTAVEQAMASAHDEQTKEIYNEWKPSKTVLFNIVDRTTNPANEEVDIVELRPTAAQQVFDLMEQYAEAGQDLTDLANGIDLVVTRTGKGLNTEYSVNIKPGASAPLKADTLSKCHDLHAHIAREFFKGEENKALNAIAQISGITVPRIEGPGSTAQISNQSVAQAAAVRTPAPALASDATAVEDAHVVDETPAAPAAAPAAPVAEAAPVAQAAQAAPVAQAQTAVSPDSTLSQQDMDDVLSQLDNLA